MPLVYLNPQTQKAKVAEEMEERERERKGRKERESNLPDPLINKSALKAVTCRNPRFTASYHAEFEAMPAHRNQQKQKPYRVSSCVNFLRPAV